MTRVAKLFICIDQLTVGLALPLLPFLLKNSFFSLPFSGMLGMFLVTFSLFVYPLFAAFSSIIVGLYFDFRNKKPLWLFVSIGFSFSLFLLGLSLFFHSFLLLLLARVVGGCFGCITPLSISTLLLKAPDPNKKQLDMHIVAAILGFSWVIAYIGIDILLHHLSLIWITPSIFFLLGILSLLFGLFQYKNTLPTHPNPIILRYFQPLFNKDLRVFYLVCYLFYLGFFLGVLWSLPIAKERFALNDFALSLFFYASPLLWFITSIIAICFLLFFLDSYVIALWALFLGGLFYFLSAASSVFSLFLIPFLLSTASLSLAYANVLSLIAIKSHDSVLGLSFGLVYFMIFLSQISAPVIGGIAVFYSDTPLLYTAGVAVFTAFAILLTYFIRKHPKLLRY